MALPKGDTATKGGAKATTLPKAIPLLKSRRCRQRSGVSRRQEGGDLRNSITNPKNFTDLNLEDVIVRQLRTILPWFGKRK